VLLGKAEERNPDVVVAGAEVEEAAGAELALPPAWGGGRALSERWNCHCSEDGDDVETHDDGCCWNECCLGSQLQSTKLFEACPPTVIRFSRSTNEI
jgi:hypothetical protein